MLKLYLRTIVAIFIVFYSSYTIANNKASPQLIQHTHKKPFIILSLDGGGVRGVVAARILQEIEQRTGKPIYKSFDLIAGNSTGGLVALALTVPDENMKPKYSAKDIITLYTKNMKDVFHNSLFRKLFTGFGLWDAKYSREDIDKLLENMFGKSLLSDTLKPVLLVSYSINKQEPHFWTTRLARTSRVHNFYLKDIAGATTAAPTYFPPKEISNIDKNITYLEADGGIFANNPAVVALAEAFRAVPSIKREDIILVSIGTGAIPIDDTNTNLKESGIIGWIVKANLVDVMMSADSWITEWESAIFDLNFHRIQIHIPPDLGQLDDTSDINSLIKLTEQYIASNSHYIDNLCKNILGSINHSSSQ